jgi:3-isopropylmalate dehydratase small subunit
VAEESQVKLKKWEVENIKQGHITDPFVGYTRQILITTTDDLGLIQNEIRLAEKYPDNTTIVHNFNAATCKIQEPFMRLL